MREGKRIMENEKNIISSEHKLVRFIFNHIGA